MSTKTMWALIISFLFLFVSVGPVQAEMFIYPKEGQSKEQQEMDEFQCHKWAEEQSGVNPASVAREATAPQAQVQTKKKGGVVRGGARGAALGAVGGAIGGNAGKGAKIGAAVGALGGGMRRRQSEQHAAASQQQAQQQRAQHTQAQLDRYNKAKAVCLKGRGYSVE